MKNLTKIFFLISVIALFLTSCSNDKDDKGKVFVKIIETTENDVVENSVFKYQENQIISAENSKQRIDYTYANGLISRIVTYDKDSESSVVLEFSYENEKLVQLTSSENYSIYYSYNSDGTVSYEKFNGTTKNEAQKVYHGTLSFKNKNLIKDERLFDVLDENQTVSLKISYDYDTFNNPYYSILGYDKLLNQGALVSKNNMVQAVSETTVTEGEGTISSANIYKITYKYDADNYPVEQVSEASLTNPNYSKIQYLY